MSLAKKLQLLYTIKSWNLYWLHSAAARLAYFILLLSFAFYHVWVILQNMSGFLKCWFRNKTNLDCALVVVVLGPFPPAQNDHWRLDHPFLRWKLVSSHKSKSITWRSRACRGWRWGLRGIEGLPRWPGSRSTGGLSLLLGAQGQAPEMSGGRVLLVVVGLLLVVQIVVVGMLVHSPELWLGVFCDQGRQGWLHMEVWSPLNISLWVRSSLITWWNWIYHYCYDLCQMFS